MLGLPLQSNAVQVNTANQQTILVLGDSLSAEYGLNRNTGWVAYISKLLEAEYENFTIKNISISGDTTSGGLSRLPQALNQYKPAILIIELGSNDALRGLPLDMTRQNLANMITMAQSIRTNVLLIGMQLPPNYGKQYTASFAQIFSDLAAEYNTGLIPFLLDGFAANRDYFQADGIHPNEQAQEIMANNVWEQLEQMLLP